MKPYTLTEADRVLIGNFAGALNTGRALVPPAERFGNIGIPAVTAAPSVKWSHADELAALFERASQPDALPTLHLINPGKPGNTDLTFTPGVVEYYQAPRDGRAGCSISSGGDIVHTGAGQVAGVVERQVQATGGTPYLDVKAGEFVMHWSDKADNATSGKYNLAN